jgi:uncharacterized protein YwgA
MDRPSSSVYKDTYLLTKLKDAEGKEENEATEQIFLFDKKGEPHELLSFFRQVETISGRKKLQKIVYLLQNQGFDLEMDYSYYHYGPYSAELQAEVEELVENGFVVEERTSKGYEYHFTEKGAEFLRNLEEQLEFPKVCLDAKQLKLLNEQSSQFLELVSTYAFLLKKDYKPEQSLDKTKELKPHLAEYIDDVRDFYESL